MTSRGRGGQWRYVKSDNPGSGSNTNQDFPSLTLSWFRIGENRNITGFCTTGELFCFLGNSDRRYEHSQLLKVVAGRVDAQSLVRDTSDLAETSLWRQLLCFPEGGQVLVVLILILIVLLLLIQYKYF